MARPTIFPTWATTLANDGTTGQPNRAEPSGGKKNTGFDFNEKPPRQDLNWLHWAMDQWRAYFDTDKLQGIVVGEVPDGASLYPVSQKKTIPLRARTLAHNAEIVLPLGFGSIPTDSFLSVRAYLSVAGNSPYQCYGHIRKNMDAANTISFSAGNTDLSGGAGSGSNLYLSFYQSGFGLIDDIVIGNVTGSPKAITFGDIEVTLIPA